MAIGTAIATKIAVFAIAAPHVTGNIHNPAIKTAKVIKMIIINSAIAPINEFNVK